MQEALDFAVVAVFCHITLGAVAFLTDPRRAINQSFLLLTLLIAGWITGIQIAFLATNAGAAGFGIRLCYASAPLIPAALALLRQSIIFHGDALAAQLVRVRWWGLSGLCFTTLCLLPFFIKGINFSPHPSGITSHLSARPVFHPAVSLYYAYLAVTSCVLTVVIFRDQWRPQVKGVHGVELQFIWLAWVTLLATLCLSVALDLVFHDVTMVRAVAALRIILFDAIIVYGITSRGILQIRSVIRRGLTYGLLASYMGLIYTLLWVLLRWAYLRVGEDASFWPSVFAGGLSVVLISSLSSPLRWVTQRILPSDDMDFERVFGQMRHLLQSVVTLRELIADFSAALGQAVGTQGVRVLVPTVGGFSELDVEQEGPSFDQPGEHGLCLAQDDPVVRALRQSAPDIAVEELARHASTAEQRMLLGRLKTLDADLIVPARYRGELSAIILLSSRVGGRIYGVDGRSTLRLIAEQLGVAIVNAHLYTEAYRSQAYNRLLVEHLPCGVVTTDPKGIVRVLNPEARRLLQVDDSIAPGEIELPSSFMELVGPTLRNQVESAPEEIVLRSGSRDQANLRVNCLPLEGEHGELLGVVLVLNDHTTLEKLQRAVRQADRLASIGTLASGMAHEIKNPLTALKTFTQLLPKRYNDAEFRHDFSGLAGSEIARIERIVNQLLAFARPAPLMIEQVNLHEIIGNAVKLVGPQASRHQVRVRTAFQAEHDYIAADKDRLQQVLLNLLLNAIQANPEGGWIEVGTETEPGTAEHDAFIRLDVSDGGSGIPAEILPHIFDPFFTTKGEGTGLGLSVSYNIIAEHKGRLEVESEPGKGTCFSMYLPVC